MTNLVIQRAIKKAGGARKVAVAIDHSVQVIYRYISGDLNPSEELLKFLGLERVVIYRKRK